MGVGVEEDFPGAVFFAEEDVEFAVGGAGFAGGWIGAGGFVVADIEGVVGGSHAADEAELDGLFPGAAFGFGAVGEFWEVLVEGFDGVVVLDDP